MKALKNLFTRTTQPLNGGNAYVAGEQMKAQDTLNKQTLPAIDDASIGKTLNEIFANQNYTIWMLLLQEANYFCNMFPVKIDDTQINNLMNISLLTAFIYGKCMVVKESDNLFIPYYIIKSSFKNNGDMVPLTVAPAAQLITSNGVNFEKPNIANPIKVTQTMIDNSVILRWDTLGYGAILNILPYLNQLDNILTMITTTGYDFIKHHTLTTENPNEIVSVFKRWFNTKLPFNIELKTTADMSVDTRIRTVEQNGSANSLTIMDYFNEWNKIWCARLGKKINLNEKREREISGELDTNNDLFDILQSNHLSYLRQFCRELTELTGTKITLLMDFIEEPNMDLDKDNKEIKESE